MSTGLGNSVFFQELRFTTINTAVCTDSHGNLFKEIDEAVLVKKLKEKFGLFVDFEFLTEMGSWGTD